MPLGGGGLWPHGVLSKPENTNDPEVARTPTPDTNQPRTTKIATQPAGHRAEVDPPRAALRVGRGGEERVHRGDRDVLYSHEQAADYNKDQAERISYFFKAIVAATMPTIDAAIEGFKDDEEEDHEDVADNLSDDDV